MGRLKPMFPPPNPNKTIRLNARPAENPRCRETVPENSWGRRSAFVRCFSFSIWLAMNLRSLATSLKTDPEVDHGLKQRGLLHNQA
jgi:hypothetical protein